MSRLDRIEVLLEEMNGKFDVVLEIVIATRRELAEVKQTISVIPEMQNDIHTIKHALKLTNVQVKDHEKRLRRLETKPA